MQNTMNKRIFSAVERGIKEESGERCIGRIFAIMACGTGVNPMKIPPKGALKPKIVAENSKKI